MAINAFRLLLLLSACAVLPTVVASDLPPGVPNPVGPDGKYTRALTFTTKAYQDEAFRLLLREANQVAEELRLPERLPLTPTNIVRSFVNPFGYAYAKKAIGSITSSNYTYYFSQGNKFSYLECTHQNEKCQEYEASFLWPVTQVDTNQAYQQAVYWLAAASMDVNGLNRDCEIVIETDRSYVHPPSGKFVPVYYVYWKRPGSRRGSGVASVRIFTPTRSLLQLRVEDPKFILRKPLVVTSLDVLLSQTNALDTDPRYPLRQTNAP